MVKFECTANTSGNGLWSPEAKQVSIIGLQVRNFGNEFGELRIFFDTDTWDTYEDGLIYTDPRFEKEIVPKIKQFIGDKDNKTSIDYSEQGMQGDDYVSMDVDEKFLQYWNNRDFTQVFFD